MAHFPKIYLDENKTPLKVISIKGHSINSASEKPAPEIITNLHQSQQYVSSPKRTPQYNLAKNVEIELEGIPEDLFLEAKWKIWEVILDIQKTAFARKQESQSEMIHSDSAAPIIASNSHQTVKPQLSSSSASNPEKNIITPKVYISSSMPVSAFSPMTSQNSARYNFRPISGPVKSFVVQPDKPNVLKAPNTNTNLKRHNSPIRSESAVNTSVYAKRYHSSIPGESKTIIYAKRHHPSI